MVEVEAIEQVGERRAIGRHVRIVLRSLRVGKIVAAAGRERLELPVALDELQQRGVITVAMVYFSTRRIFPNNQQRHTSSIAEEFDRLTEPPIPIPSAPLPHHN